MRERLDDLPPLGEPDEDGRWMPPEDEAPRAAPLLRATPYVYRPPAEIPTREWVYGKHLIRRFLSTTVAPGAVGKSSLVLVEAIAMVTGRPLLGIQVPHRLRVWVANLEDPLEELERRVAAICLHYGIDPRELEGRLFLDSGRTAEIIIARRERDGVKVAEPLIAALVQTLRDNRIDHMTVDPFVSSHRVTENANDEIDIVAKAWNRVAETASVSIELVHHVRKGQGGAGEHTVEDGRGAGALLAAARSARVLNPMTKDEAAKAGLPSHRGYFRVDNGKANLAPPPDRSEWFHLTSISLGNGPAGLIDASDHVAVVEPWEWPDAFDGISLADLIAAQAAVAEGGPWRASPQSPAWVGRPIARALRMDPDDKVHRQRVTRLLKTWMETGMFVTVEAQDEARKVRQFVEVGTRASATPD